MPDRMPVPHSGTARRPAPADRPGRRAAPQDASRAAMGRGGALAAVFLALLGLLPAAAQAPSSTAASGSGEAARCAALAGMRIDDTNLLSATAVPATGDLPAHCRVLGYVRPAINFELRLPLAGWNGKFYMTGCGGYCGKVLGDAPGFTNALNYGLRRGYAAATTDSGHWGTGSTDGRWAWNNRLAEIDWGTRAVPEVTRVSKLLVNALYERPAAKSYFAGCSTGGRQALMEAQRFPDDFDGIIAGSPALDYTGLVATAMAWTTRANAGPDGKRLFDPAHTPLVQKAVAEACDGADGLKDGLVSDPRHCGFDPAKLQCAAGQNGPDCLGEAEVGVLKAWYAPPRNSRGESLYPGGIPLGSEPFWPVWLAGTAATPPLNPLFNRDFLRYMAFAEDPGEGYDPLTFDFDRDPPRLAAMGALYNAASPDLARFRARGGKLIVYHGWADAIVTPERTVQWFEAASAAAGGRDAIAGTARLFMLPGFDHCGLSNAGPGIDQNGFDPLGALEAWVERGEAPAQLATTKTATGGQRLWSRPVCPWPQVPRHDGKGPVAEAASFACADP